MRQVPHQDGFDCDLLIVGLGPVGDVLAGLARLHGLSVIAVDAEAHPYPLPRAAVFDHEIMRIFQAVGVADRVGPLCRVPDRYQFLTAAGEVLLDFPVALVTRSGWAETYALHQPAVEELLGTRLTELAVDVRRGVRLTALSQETDSVLAHLDGAGGGSKVRTRYLIGADGASSTVRTLLGIPLSDYCFDEPWLVLDTILDDATGLPTPCEQICDPRRPISHIAMGHRRFRWEFMLKPGESPEDLLCEQRIFELLTPWPSERRALLEGRGRIERKAVYRFHALVAERWRQGRVLLAGDAAHQMPPFAGQGMCAGIRDAANLSWKLALVLRGHASEAILDTYQIEREPHVRTIIETAVGMGRVVCELDPVAAAKRDAAMLAARRNGEKPISVDYPGLQAGMLTTTPGAGTLYPQPIIGSQRLDDALGRDPVLLGRGVTATARGVASRDLSDPALSAFAPAIDAWLQSLGAQAALIRPDRYVFGTGASQELLAAWSRQSGAAPA